MPRGFVSFYVLKNKIRSNGSSESSERLELGRVLFDFGLRNGVEDAWTSGAETKIAIPMSVRAERLSV